MRVKSLKINNLRNIGSADIEPDSCLNLLLGDNGAGKTSVLEALVVLAKGRSFRSATARPLIGPGGDHVLITAEIESAAGRRHRLGLERGASSWRARRDGSDVRRFSDLGRDLPLVVMEPDSHELVSGAPERRRRFLDWGVFHVEHGFLDDWRRYERALRQRNAALRRGGDDLLDALDPQVATLGERLGAARGQHCAAVSESLAGLLPRLSPGLGSVVLEYRPGWSGDDLLGSLAVGRDGDRERGATRAGPHRGDIRIMTDRGEARDVLSRGESKTMAAALLLAQAGLLVASGRRPALLLDDLASELDADHRDRALQESLALDLQVWITGTRPLPGIDAFAPSLRMFHVEQGAVSEMV